MEDGIDVTKAMIEKCNKELAVCGKFLRFKKLEEKDINWWIGARAAILEMKEFAIEIRNDLLERED